jgi:hypothetical protein
MRNTHYAMNLRSCFVELLQKLVCCELDRLVSPLGGAIVAGDQPRTMDTPEVPEHERVPRLGVLVGAVGEPEKPPPVRLPFVGVQVGILGGSRGLDLAPLAAQDVLAGADQSPRVRDACLVDRVRGRR